MKATYKRSFAQMMLLLLCFLLIGTTFSPPSLVEASSKIATLTDIKGDVFIKKGGGKREVKASNDMGVTQGDTIRTGKKAYAKVVFDSKNATSLGENTTITVAKLAEKNGVSTTKVKQTSGKVWNKVSKSSYEVETPTAIMGVRGTMFLTHFDERTRTTMRIFDGVVATRDRLPTRDGDERLVYQFEQLRSNLYGIEPMSESDIQDLVRGVDERLIVTMVIDMFTEIREYTRQSEEIFNLGEPVSIEELIKAVELSQGAENLHEVTELLLRHIENEGMNDLRNQIDDLLGDTRPSFQEEIRRNQLLREEAIRREELLRGNNRAELLRERQEALRKQAEQLRGERQREETPTQSRERTDSWDDGDTTPVNPPTPPVEPPTPPRPVQPIGECGRVECKELELFSESTTHSIWISWYPYDEMKNFDHYRVYINDIEKGRINGNEQDDRMFTFESLEPDTLYMIKVAAYAKGARYPEAIAVLEARTEMEYGMVSGSVFLCEEYDWYCETPSPLVEKLVTIIDEQENEVAQGLTDSSGNYSFVVPVGTNYRIFVDHNNHRYENYYEEYDDDYKTYPHAWIAMYGETWFYTFDVNINEKTTPLELVLDPSILDQLPSIPDTINNLIVTGIGRDYITVAWDPYEIENPNFQFKEYRLFINDEEVGYVNLNEPSATTFMFEYLDWNSSEKLKPNTEYTIRIEAWRIGGDYPEAIGEITATTTD